MNSLADTGTDTAGVASCLPTSGKAGALSCLTALSFTSVASPSGTEIGEADVPLELLVTFFFGIRFETARFSGALSPLVDRSFEELPLAVVEEV